MTKNAPTINFDVTFIVEPVNGAFYAYSPAIGNKSRASGSSEKEALDKAKQKTKKYLTKLLKDGQCLPDDLLQRNIKQDDEISLYPISLEVAIGKALKQN